MTPLFLSHGDPPSETSEPPHWNPEFHVRGEEKAPPFPSHLPLHQPFRRRPRPPARLTFLHQPVGPPLPGPPSRRLRHTPGPREVGRYPPPQLRCRLRLRQAELPALWGRSHDRRRKISLVGAVRGGDAADGVQRAVGGLRQGLLRWWIDGRHSRRRGKVLPSFQGLGIGKMIVQRIIRVLTNKGIYDISALCSKEESAFFRACGFRDDMLGSITMMYTRAPSCAEEGDGAMVRRAGRLLLVVPRELKPFAAK